MKWILHLVSVKNITFKSSYNWFKIEFFRLLRPPTAIFSHVHSHQILSFSITYFILSLINVIIESCENITISTLLINCAEAGKNLGMLFRQKINSCQTRDLFQLISTKELSIKIKQKHNFQVVFKSMNGYWEGRTIHCICICTTSNLIQLR